MANNQKKTLHLSHIKIKQQPANSGPNEIWPQNWFLNATINL